MQIIKNGQKHIGTIISQNNSKNMKYIYIITLLLTITSCSEYPIDAIRSNTIPNIYPDYIDVTIPIGIAPLNFNINDKSERLDVVVKGENGGEIHSNGDYANFGIDEWHELLSKNIGTDLIFTVSNKTDGKWFTYNDFRIHVSCDSLNDYGLTYRKFAPVYENYGKIGIYQRQLSTFDEEPIVENTAAPGQCVGCHTPNRTNPKQFTVHYRGTHGATLVQINGKRNWLTTKTDSTISNGMYAYWHPSGNYCAYSLDNVYQCFYVGQDRVKDVYDHASDLMVLDVRTNEILLSPLLQTKDYEIFPVFSADGKTLYYCLSAYCETPYEIEKLHYNLMSISFDEVTGTFGEKVDTIINAESQNISISHPRPSYDGRYIMYTVSSYGFFTVEHNDADLWLYDISNKTSRELTELNTDKCESYHNWSSNSRWFVFASRREDGTYSRLYIANIDKNGNVSKPFLLPQKNPAEYYSKSRFTYNTPDFTLTPVNFDTRAACKELFSDKRIQATIRK